MTANGRVLVLNKSWVPVNVLPVLDAVSKVFKGRAMFLDTETYRTYDFESWVDDWTEAVRSAKIASDQALRLGSDTWMKLPEVIICTEYRGFGYKVSHRRPKFSRTNIYRRDRNTCQFCGKKFKTEDLTMDHVIPKSKGGQMTWLNVVLACYSCNNKKSDKTMEQAGMRLIRRPVVPTVDDLKRTPIEKLMHKVGNRCPKTWEAFLGKMSPDKFLSRMYWEVELQD